MSFYRKRAYQQGHWPSGDWPISLCAMRNGTLLAIVAVLLSACGSWPELDAPLRNDPGAWPVLLPLDDVSGLSDNDGSAQSEAQRLASRAAALRARAAVMRRPVSDGDAMEALRARLAR